MTPERHALIGNLYHQVLELPVERRAKFIRTVCANDEEMRRELESLLAAHDDASRFLAAPAIEVAAADLVSPRSRTADTHAPGTIGQYRLGALLGRGGMGEVYQAHDTRLGRDVAIKILPPVFKTDRERLARFDREARVLAALNHPHIAAIYGVEHTADVNALVMELVGGENLAQRLARGALPCGEALAVARQIADAIEAAHAGGVVHRDLKPANVKIRGDGTVKVLDFGLAKASDLPTSPDAPSLAPTETGMVLGTPAYMSPEQARGEDTDHQSDIWAFGVVLFELLTATSPFARATTADTLAAVIGSAPDYSRLPAETPASVRRLLRHCLEKTRARRYRHIGDVRLQLEDALEPDSALPAAATRQPAKHLAWAWISGALLVAASLVFLALPNRTVIPVPGLVRFSVLPPDHGLFLTPLPTGSSAPVGGTISPDGRTLAYTARDASGTVLLWVRAIDSISARPLPGTENAGLPFWAPDSKALGFFGLGQLKTVDLASGAVQVVCRVTRGRGGSWNRNGIIVFSPALADRLLKVSATGGTPTPLTTLAPSQRSHRFPYFLPDQNHFLYYVEDVDTMKTGIYVSDLNQSTNQLVLTADSAAAFAAPNQLLFVRQGTLFAQPFDPSSFQTTGKAITLATAVSSEGSAPAFSVSDSVLTYLSGPSTDQQFAWFDRSGRLLQTIGPPGNYRGMDLSPDGTRIAVHRHEGDNGGDIWVIEPQGTLTRVTANPERDNQMPIWSPDGSRIAFGSLRDGKWGVFIKKPDASAGDELLVESAVPKIPASWTTNGDAILDWHFANGGDIWVAHVPHSAGSGQTTAPAEETPLVSTPFSEGHAQVSPDGKWLAYVSTLTGTGQLYVRPYPAGDAIQVSTNGAVTPRWSRDGTELFYISSYDDGTLMSLRVRSDRGRLTVETPRPLFKVEMVTPPHSSTINTYHTYAVSPDSQRFLIPRPPALLKDDAIPTPITVVLHWTAMVGAR